jgi:hypothetical protein
MKLLTSLPIFWDDDNIPVGYYRDKLGRIWMGNMQSRFGGWQMGFIRATPMIHRYFEIQRHNE